MFFHSLHVSNKNDLEMIVCFIRNSDNCIHVTSLFCSRWIAAQAHEKKINGFNGNLFYNAF